MGILLRSAVVIGVLVYLAPIRQDPQTKPIPAETKPGELSLSGTAGAVWQALPDAARKAVADEAGKQLLDNTTRQWLPDCAKTGIPCSPSSLPEKKPKPSD